MTETNVYLKPGDKLIVRDPELPAFCLEKDYQGFIRITFIGMNGVFEVGERHGRPVVRVHDLEKYQLKTNEMFGETKDGPVILRMFNPDVKGAWVEWPDRSSFYVYLDNYQLSEDAMKRFVAWHNVTFLNK